ncbi:TauD/TfdA family dioxygenase (plasmid) [Nocardia sp. NBC_01377]|uniref:TauD/TfdA family dioxygenase n=1 Tax=Nocardia sp. NBC_01377 TaxID=2903595 RepID=UPI002F919711
MHDLLNRFDRSTIPSFAGLAELPAVEVDSFTAISAEARAQIVSRYQRHGICLIAAKNRTVTDDSINAVAAALALGPTFTPSLYRGTAAMSDGIARMCADNRTAQMAHPSFDSTKGQPLHSDGTLESIGEVKTSLLLCVQPAHSGGTTFFVNTTAIFAELADSDPAAAAALMHPHALVRVSNLPGAARSVSIGPGLSTVDGDLLTRLSLTPTDSWQIPDDEDGLALMRALATMIRGRRERDPRYYVEFSLEQGMGVLFANDRLGHGRHDYTNSDTRTRRMIRGLFTTRPSNAAVGALTGRQETHR